MKYIKIIRPVIIISFLIASCTKPTSVSYDETSSASLTVYSGRVEVPLPIAKPRFFIEETSEIPERKGPFKDIKLFLLPAEETGENYVPETFKEAVKELREMLSPNYRNTLMERYGYIPQGKKFKIHSAIKEDLEYRIGDLQRFLYDIWNLYDTDHRLGKEIDCLGSFEFSLTPLFLALAINEVNEYGGKLALDMHSAEELLYQLEFLCSVE